jgi:hypothetical protein
MAKKKASKSGVFTFRMPPELHEDIAVAAAALGLDVTGMIRLMIRRSLPHFQLEARLITTMAEQGEAALQQWRHNNPERPVREFLDDHVRQQRHQWVKDQVQFWHDIRFTLDQAYAATSLEGGRIPSDATHVPPRPQQPKEES